MRGFPGDDRGFGRNRNAGGSVVSGFCRHAGTRVRQRQCQCQIAAHLNPLAVRHRVQGDVLNRAAHLLTGRAGVLAVEGRDQICDLGAV